VNNIITYLFIGTCWVLVLDISSHYFSPNNTLTPAEKVVTGLIWPITFIIFMYHFIKGWFNNEV